MSKTYFGTDGIRGEANTGRMSPATLLRIAMAAGRACASVGHRPRVVIGKDTRLSGYSIEAALVAGFTSVGMDVFQLGPMPTPAVAMLTRSMRADLGVMISASHNPYEDNGLKFFGADGFKLADEVQDGIEAAIEQPEADNLVRPAFMGRARRVEGAQERYIEFAKRTFPRELTLDGLRIVVDCAHGASYTVAPQALWELGAEVVKIGNEPNGTNINEKSGSNTPEIMAEKVREVRADLGIALDGDADRLIVCDETGRTIDGDQLMAVIARSWKRSGRLSGDVVVATVMSNLGFERYVETLGLKLARVPVGDRHVIAEMRKRGANLGGENSGHIILSDHATTGDGLVSALQVLACLVEEGGKMSALCRAFEPVPQLMRSVRTTGGKPLANPRVKKAIASAQSRLNGCGRLVVRASGTEPVIRVMAEAEDDRLIDRLVGEIAASIEAG
jgi:phosphoglucosamine mutase